MRLQHTQVLHTHVTCIYRSVFLYKHTHTHKSYAILLYRWRRRVAVLAATLKLVLHTRPDDVPSPGTGLCRAAAAAAVTGRTDKSIGIIRVHNINNMH